jgi:hypothetical protein
VNWFIEFWKGVPQAQPGRFLFMDESLTNFTPRAQQVLSLARKEAERLNHNFLGTEHVLLGLIKLGQGVAVNVLTKMGLDLESVRKEVEQQVGTGPDQQVPGNIPYTPRVKKVITLAAQEAKQLNHTYVGTEHLLLGLLREGDGVAAKVMRSLNVDLAQTRQEILRELDPNYSPATKSETDKPGSAERAAAQPRFKFPTEAAAPKVAAQPEPARPELIDVRQRYDVYCAEGNQALVVYRNALVKGIKRLLEQRQFASPFDFVEVEQADGHTILLAKHSIIKLCAPGVTPDAGTVSRQTPN